MAKKESFEESLEKLESIVSSLESENLDLDKSLKEFESGVKLYKSCKEYLDKAEKKITKLTEDLKLEEYTDSV